jgi:acetylornithine deacetylase/succinyl-diaminopimelate desuccinylase-like protein
MRRVAIWSLGLCLSAGGVSAETAAGSGAEEVRKAVREHCERNGVALLQEFAELLRIPNLASDAVNIRSNAKLIAAMLERRGVSSRLLETAGGPPVVFGELRAPGASHTIVVYAHYDGQPVEPADWATDPWTPVLREGEAGAPVSLDSVTGPLEGEWRLYGRSTGDDKAPVLGWLAAIDALRAGSIPLSVNVKFFFEGEEEAGSPHLPAILAEHADLLAADTWLLCDGPVHQSRRMQVFFGARGIIGLRLTLFGPTRPLHSGHYGNWAPNPAARLAHLIAGLRDENGRVQVAGFYDDVRPLTPAERQALATVPDADPTLRHELGLAATEAGGALLKDRIMLPALNVKRLVAGGSSGAAANAIPTEASASLGFRLVPDQTPASVREKVEAHLRSEGYHIVRDVPDLEARRSHER